VGSLYSNISGRQITRRSHVILSYHVKYKKATDYFIYAHMWAKLLMQIIET